MRSTLVSLLLLAGLAGSAAFAQDTPAGVWRTIDDKTGKERSVIRITESGGTYQGTIEQLLNRQPDDDPQGLCRKCEGERKDQPVVGMTILWGLKQNGDEYTGGQILDPKNGKTYRAKMKLTEGGKKLEVRGFIGVSMFGRSQTWIRQQ